MQNILNYKMVLLKKQSDSEILKKIEEYYEEKTRVTVICNDSSKYECLYVYSEIYKEKTYDFDNNEFISITNEKYNAVDFEFDTIEQSLVIWGSKKGAQKVISMLALMFENQIIIEPYEFSFEKAIDFLKEMPLVTVGKVKASDVVLDKDVIAECVFNLSIVEKPFVLLDKYKKNLKNIRFELCNDNNRIGITLYQTGALVVHKPKDLISNEILKNINQIVVASRR